MLVGYIRAGMIEISFGPGHVFSFVQAVFPHAPSEEETDRPVFLFLVASCIVCVGWSRSFVPFVVWARSRIIIPFRFLQVTGGFFLSPTVCRQGRFFRAGGWVA